MFCCGVLSPPTARSSYLQRYAVNQACREQALHVYFLPAFSSHSFGIVSFGSLCSTDSGVPILDEFGSSVFGLAYLLASAAFFSSEFYSLTISWGKDLV